MFKKVPLSSIHQSLVGRLGWCYPTPTKGWEWGEVRNSTEIRGV